MGLFDIFRRKDAPLNLAKVRRGKILDEALKKGELVIVYLTPLAFDGAEDETNAIYTPPAAAKIKQQCDDTAERLFVKGEISEYRAMPQYKGKSIVPSCIKIRVTGTTSFEQTIRIW